MVKRFVSEPLEARYGEGSQRQAVARESREPALPGAFRWGDRTIVVKAVRALRHSTKVDRGDTYLKRHWFEIEIDAGGVATVYFDRAAKRGEPRWWLYAIEEPA